MRHCPLDLKSGTATADLLYCALWKALHSNDLFLQYHALGF